MSKSTWLIFPNRILHRILLPMTVLLLVSNLLTLAITYIGLDGELRKQDDTLLSSDIELPTLYFQSEMSSLEADLQQAADFPAVQEFVRWELSDSELAGDQSEQIEEWRGRVNQLFKGVLEAKSSYVQIRLLKEDGTEVVRVDRYGDDDGLRIVSGTQLQNKGERDYFIKASQLDGEEVYLSSIELNREHGEIQEPRQLVVRAARPIFHPSSGERYGILLINKLFNGTLRTMASLVDDDRHLLMVNAEGRYLLHPNRSKTLLSPNTAENSLHDDYPALAEKVSKRTDGTITFDQYRIAVSEIDYGSEDNVHLILVRNSAALVQVRDKVFQQTGALLLVVLGFALLISLWTARRIANPVEAMSNAVLRAPHKPNLAATIPRRSPSELTHLATSFDAAYELLNESQAQLRLEIQEKDKAKAELENKLELLDSKNAELQQFTYIASHDLQEPLRTIRSFAGVLSKKYGSKLDDQGRQMLGFVDDASLRMQNLVKDLLDYGRIGREVEPKEVDLSKLIEDVKSDIAESIMQRAATISADRLPIVPGLETELRLLLQNLISNAIKFTPSDRNPQIKIDAIKLEDRWQIGVHDNGIGIEAKYRDKVFGVFKRLHNRNEYPGTGIGLAHCKKVVECHGGEIWITGNEAQGTSVLFTLRKVS